MTRIYTRVELSCDSCGSYMSEAVTLEDAIRIAREHGDAVDTDYDPCRTLCGFCKMELALTHDDLIRGGK